MKEYKENYGDIKLSFTEKDITVSTNEDAKAKKEHGGVIIAKRQTGGKGRKGRTFVSNGGGVYMSAYFDADYLENKGEITFITGAAAAAAAKAIEKLSNTETKIKWVNDIYQNGKKVCGILAEAETQNEKISGVVLGVGVNLLKTAEFPEEIKEIAGFVFKKGDFETLKKDFCNLFFEEFFYFLGNKPQVEKIYNEKNYLLNKKIKFGENQVGEVIKINPDLSLAVRENEKTYNLFYGEAEILK